MIRYMEPIKSSIRFGSISNNIFGNNVAMTKGTLVTKEVTEINAQLNEPSELDIAIKGNSSVIINSLGEASDCHRMELKMQILLLINLLYRLALYLISWNMKTTRKMEI